MQQPLGREQEYTGAADLWSGQADAGAQTELLEALAERDEALLELYMAGGAPDLPFWKKHLQTQAAAGRIFPLV
ncbi:hypothetical protein D3C75_1101400 [compost metagenome]